MKLKRHSIHLIVQYYRCTDSRRQIEIDTCLDNNLQNPLIDTVHLLTEEFFDLSRFSNHDKVIQTVIGERLTYKRAFIYANDVDPSGERIWILSNADIYFDDSLAKIVSCEMKDIVFSLSRYECDSSGGAHMLPVEQARGGQDSWIFCSPVNLEKMFTSFFLGIPCCDYRINYELINAGYFVINPSLVVKSFHLDLVGNSIIEKSMKYMANMTDENIQSGSVAPPPYHYGLYPVDKLAIDKKELFVDYCQTVNNLIKNEWETNNIKKQIDSMDMFISALNVEINALRNEITARDCVINSLHAEIERINSLYDELDSYYKQLKNSLSWKLTAPLRAIIDWIRFKIKNVTK